jgi:hypothetical protein
MILKKGAYAPNYGMIAFILFLYVIYFKIRFAPTAESNQKPLRLST